MSLLRKLSELLPFRYLPRQIKLEISKKDIENFCLLALICFMIIIYKVNKAS
jgi:hypothetical protein